MKHSRITAILCTALLSACSSVPSSTTANSASIAEEPVQEDIQEEIQEDTTMKMMIADTPVTIQWEDNASVAALQKLAENEPLVIDMSMYGGFEQVGPIGTTLPADDVQTTTAPGDIVLYSRNQLVVFCGTNSWAYTRLGHITDRSEQELRQLLMNGDITITITVE